MRIFGKSQRRKHRFSVKKRLQIDGKINDNSVPAIKHDENRLPGPTFSPRIRFWTIFGFQPGPQMGPGSPPGTARGLASLHRFFAASQKGSRPAPGRPQGPPGDPPGTPQGPSRTNFGTILGRFTGEFVRSILAHKFALPLSLLLYFSIRLRFDT